MQILELTLDSIERNLALDEALLEHAESRVGASACVGASALDGESLRLWESPEYAVVIGRSTKIEDEVDTSACNRLGIPVRRRASGGTSVVIGPGCLMYAVVLSLEHRPECRRIDQAHELVMSSHARVLRDIDSRVDFQGTCDLTIDNRKFSGNSLKYKRSHVLYHGTILYDFDLPLIERLLKRPVRTPEYRADRSHGEFIMNLEASSNDLRRLIQRAWSANQLLNEWPTARTNELALSRYALDEWNRRH